jgi:hypothetical protein
MLHSCFRRELPNDWKRSFPMKIEIFVYNGRMFIFYIAMNDAAPKQGFLCGGLSD